MIAAIPRIVRIIAATSAAATLGFLAWVADWSLQPMILGFMIGMVAWCLSPYGVLALAARSPGKSPSSAIALLAMAIVVPGFAAVIYVDAFFVHLDAQGGLVFLFVPGVQWAAMLVGIVAMHLLDRRTRER